MQPPLVQSNLPYYNNYTQSQQAQRRNIQNVPPQRRNNLNQSYDMQPNNYNNYSMFQQQPGEYEAPMNANYNMDSLNRSYDVNIPNPLIQINDPNLISQRAQPQSQHYQPPYQQQYQLPQQQQPDQAYQNSAQAAELKNMIDSQNNMIMQMINKMQDDKEKKMRDKNVELMKRIKRLERKKRKLNGEEVQSEDDDYMSQYQQDQQQQQQYLPQQDMMMPQYQNNDNLQGSDSRDDKESVFHLADSLQPGTFVPIVPFNDETEYFADNPFYDGEDKIRQIKEKLRDKVGDYGNHEGMSLQDRVKMKVQQYNSGIPIPKSRGSQKTKVSLFLGHDENAVVGRESILESRQSIKFQEVETSDHQFDNSFMGKFLKKIERDKLVVGQMYQNVKKDIPKRDYADIVRDFRIDEEEGMARDPKLEPKENNKDKLSLIDKISQIQRDKINQFIQNDLIRSSIQAPQQQNIDNQLNLIQEILDYEKNEEKILDLVDKKYPYEEDFKKWIVNLIKPFLLTLFNEPRYDYSQLIIEEAKRQYGLIEVDKVDDGEGEIIRISRENLKKKFEIRVKQLTSCFLKLDLRQVPTCVLDHLKTLTQNPNKEDLTFTEINRLTFNPSNGSIDMIQTPEEIMLIGMFIIGKILTVKIFLNPQQSGIGVQPSKLIKRNLKVFATVLYQTFLSFVNKSIKVKKTDFRNDSDLISQALYDKYIIQKYLIDMQKQHEIEQILLEFIGKLQYHIKEVER